jgi:hypothetical protein
MKDTDKRAYLKVSPDLLVDALGLPPSTVLIDVKAIFDGESTARATMFEFYISNPDLPDGIGNVRAEFYSGWRFIKA